MALVTVTSCIHNNNDTISIDIKEASTRGCHPIKERPLFKTLFYIDVYNILYRDILMMIIEQQPQSR